jgi:hypothetical protein
MVFDDAKNFQQLASQVLARWRSGKVSGRDPILPLMVTVYQSPAGTMGWDFQSC